MTAFQIISVILMAALLFASGLLWAHSIQQAKAKAAHDKLIQEACAIVAKEMSVTHDPKSSHCKPESSLAFKFLLMEQMKEAFKRPTGPPKDFDPEAVSMEDGIP